MYNAQTNQIIFPHIIIGDVLNGEKKTFNSINGGIVPIGNLNLARFRFFGGNVTHLGMMKEYGVYACPHYEKNTTILGFYVSDPAIVTEKGREAIKNHYPNYNIVWDVMTPEIPREMSAEEIKKKQDLIKEVVDHGARADQVTNITVDELEGLLKAQSSGKSGKKVAVESPTLTPNDDIDPQITHLGKSKNT